MPESIKPKSTRNLWPTAIIAYFIFFFSFTVCLVVWAVHQRVDLVSRKYYDEEINFQKHLDQLNRTQPVHAQVSVSYDARSQQITIRLPDAADRGIATGTVQFYRPSDERMDQTVPLAIGIDGAQQFDARKLPPGFWKVHLQWATKGQEFFFDQPLVIATHPS